MRNLLFLSLSLPLKSADPLMTWHGVKNFTKEWLQTQCVSVCRRSSACLSVRMSHTLSHTHSERTLRVASSSCLAAWQKPSRNLFFVNFICALRLYQWLICFFQQKFPFFEPWSHAQLHVFNFGNVNVKFRISLYSANSWNAGSSVILNYSVPLVLTVFLHYLFTVFRTC